MSNAVPPYSCANCGKRADLCECPRVVSRCCPTCDRLTRELAELQAVHAVVCKEVHDGELNECRLERELAEARAALERAKKDALDINKKVSTFGLAHGMVARIDAFLAAADQPDAARLAAVRDVARMGQEMEAADNSASVAPPNAWHKPPAD